MASSTIRPRPHRTGGDVSSADPAEPAVPLSSSSSLQRRKQQPPAASSSPSRTQPPPRDGRRNPYYGAAPAALVAVTTLLLSVFVFGLLVRTFDPGSSSSSSSSSSSDNARQSTKGDAPPPITGAAKKATATQHSAAVSGKDLVAGDKASSYSLSVSCPYTSIQDFTELERYPKATHSRHMVDPPRTQLPSINQVEADSAKGSKLTLVCCHTTKGPWSIAVREAWAPIGSQRFLDMVQAKYFQGNPDDASDQGVPLMRCVPKFLCQFGLAGKRSEQFQSSLPDDPQWLPAGPDHRLNELGVRRFQKGYMSYAGGGPNSRDNQLFVALADNGPLGGGSPWEVPWGELVGNHSYETLDKIYTGYGEDGPSQHLLWEDQSLPVVHKEFPLLDWIVECHVVDEIVDG